MVTYYLKERPEDEVTLSFLDSKGQTIKSFSSTPADDAQPPGGPEEPSVPVEPGMNRFEWDTRYPDARQVQRDGEWDKVPDGPLAPPGVYQVRISARGEIQTQSLELLTDPRISATQEDLEAQFELLTRIRDKVSEAHDGINEIASIRRQVDEWVTRAESKGAGEAVSSGANLLKDTLSAIEKQLIQLKARGDLDRISQPARLNVKLAELTSVVASADFAPTGSPTRSSTTCRPNPTSSSRSCTRSSKPTCPHSPTSSTSWRYRPSFQNQPHDPVCLRYYRGLHRALRLHGDGQLHQCGSPSCAPVTGSRALEPPAAPLPHALRAGWPGSRTPADWLADGRDAKVFLALSATKTAANVREDTIIPSPGTQKLGFPGQRNIRRGTMVRESHPCSTD